MKRIDYIIEKTISRLIEQEPAPAAGDAGKKKETDNAPSSADVSPFTPAEEKFLGKFDAYGTIHLGIIYSPTDIGIREFIARSGNDLNCTPSILLKLLRNKIIKIVPYTGFGRNTDYTIELQLSLDDVKGMGAEDKETAEAGSSAPSAPAGGEIPPAPAPENAGYTPTGNLISERRKQIQEQLLFLINEETSTSAAKKYLLSKDKDIVSKINLAARFWKGMIAVGFTDVNWDEDHYVNTFNNVLFNYTKFSGRERAIYIDSLGSILRLARQEDPAAVAFLTDFIDYEFDVTLNINKLGKYQSSIGGMLTSAQMGWIVEELDDPQVFLDKFDNKGIGKVIIRDVGFAPNYYPTYSENEVNAQVLRWLAPYKSSVTTDKAGHEKIKQVKPINFYDTLTPEQRKQRAKWALSQINSNIRKYFSSATKAVVKKTTPTIQSMPGFAGAWVDKKGYGFAYLKYNQGKVGRLYPDGKYVLMSSKGVVERTGKWEIDYSKSTGKFRVTDK